MDGSAVHRASVACWDRLVNPARIGWTVLAVLVLAFVVFESVKYGRVATAVVLAFALLPAVSRVPGVPGWLHAPLHRPWLPLALLVIGVSVPVPPLGWGLRGGLELFLAGSAWLLHLAAERAAGVAVRGGAPAPGAPMR